MTRGATHELTGLPELEDAVLGDEVVLSHDENSVGHDRLPSLDDSVHRATNGVTNEDFKL